MRHQTLEIHPLSLALGFLLATVCSVSFGMATTQGVTGERGVIDVLSARKIVLVSADGVEGDKTIELSNAGGYLSVGGPVSLGDSALRCGSIAIDDASGVQTSLFAGKLQVSSEDEGVQLRTAVTPLGVIASSTQADSEYSTVVSPFGLWGNEAMGQNLDALRKSRASRLTGASASPEDLSGSPPKNTRFLLGMGVLAQGLVLNNNEGARVVSLGASATSKSGLLDLYSVEGWRSIRLSSTESGGAILVENRTGQAAATIIADDYGHGEVGAWDREGNGRTLKPGP